MGKRWVEGRNSDTGRSAGTKDAVSILDSRRKCHLCGNGFNTGSFDMTQYAYKVGNKVFCCYAHYSEYLRTLEGEHIRRVLMRGRFF